MSSHFSSVFDCPSYAASVPRGSGVGEDGDGDFLPLLGYDALMLAYVGDNEEGGLFFFIGSGLYLCWPMLPIMRRVGVCWR